MNQSSTSEAVRRQTQPKWVAVWLCIALAVWLYESSSTAHPDEVHHAER